MYLIHGLDNESLESIEGLIKGGKTIDEAVDMFLRMYMDCIRGADLTDKILFKIWMHHGMGPDTDEGEIYYPNDRESIIESVSADTDKARDYLYNCIYKLKHRGLIATKQLRDKGKVYTLLSLTDEGNEWIERIKDTFKSDYLRQIGERGQQQLSHINNNNITYRR